MQDDDSGGDRQFLITYMLHTSDRYILVKTTYRPNVTASFSISGSGPGRIIFIPLNNSSTTPITTETLLVSVNQSITTRPQPVTICEYIRKINAYY